MAKGPELTVVMPAYNEGPRIGESLRVTCAVMEGLGKTFEIIVVDDGSGDWTQEEAQKAALSLPQVRVLRVPINQGKGWALKEGFRACEGEWVAFLDADLDLDPAQLRRFFEIQQETRADVVIGSKWHPESQVEYPLKRRIISRGYYAMVKLLFGMPLRDTQTGLKIFRHEVLRQVFPKALIKRYAIDLELLVVAHHLGFTIAEAPVLLNYRPKFGHIGLKAIFNVAWDTAAVFYRLRIKRSYDRREA